MSDGELVPAGRPVRADIVETCRICDRETPLRCKVGPPDGPSCGHLTAVKVPLCEQCADRGLLLTQAGAFIEMRRPSAPDEVIGRFPVQYSDQQMGRMEMGEWVSRASLSALRSVWDMAQENKHYLSMVQYRIAFTVKQRLGFYGGGWAAEAGKVLQRHEEVVRNYATIWERLGELLADDERRLGLGYSLLLRAASAPDPKAALDSYEAQREAGARVRQVEAPDCSHVWITVCRQCGIRQTAAEQD